MTTISIDDKTMTALFPNEEMVKDHKEDVLQILQEQYAKGVKHIEMRLRGEGDSGCVDDIVYFTSNKMYSAGKGDYAYLSSYLWALSDHHMSGFETEDGGGMEVDVRFTDSGAVKVSMTGWFNVVTEETQFSFES